MRAVILFALVWIWPALATAAQPPSASPDGIDLLVAAIQQAAQAGDPLALRSLARLDTDAGQLADFVNAMTSPAPSKATIKERDRARLMSGRQRLMLEVLIEHAREGRVSTWRVDVAPRSRPRRPGRMRRGRSRRCSASPPWADCIASSSMPPPSTTSVT